MLLSGCVNDFPGYNAPWSSTPARLQKVLEIKKLAKKIIDYKK